MSNVFKHIISLLLSVIMLLSMAPTALADLTSVKVILYGLTALPDGEWQSERLEGSFQVYQNGTEIGTLKAGDDYTLNLPASDNVMLVPITDSISSDYIVSETGSSVAITAGHINLVRLMVYADRGIVQIMTDGAAEYSIYLADATMDPEGLYTYVFATDQSGRYTIPTPVRTGVYVLHQLTPVTGQEIMPDIGFVVPQYTGFANDIAIVDMRAETIKKYGVPSLSDMLGTDAQIASAPEATPEATPEPQTLGNNEATAIVQMNVSGADAPISYRIVTMDDASLVISEGSFSMADPLNISGIRPDNYVLELIIPENYVLDSINSQQVSLTSSLRCLLPVGSAYINQFNFVLSDKGKINGTLSGSAQPSAITLVGGQDKGSAVISNGCFVLDDLMAGEYRVNVTLPDGLYTGEGWSFEAADGCINAVTSYEYDGQRSISLPAINIIATGTASGRVTNKSGKPVANADVSLMDAFGNIVAVVRTDASGNWQTNRLAVGQYAVSVMQNGDTIAHGIEVQLTETSDTPVNITVQEGNASISICVFNDRNKNAEFSTYDEYLNSIEVELIHVEGQSEAVMTSGTTDKKGIVTFSELPAGQYRIRVKLPVGYGFSKKSEKSGYRYTSNMMEMISESIQTSELLTISTRDKLQAGVGAMQMSGVSGRIWLDENADGSMVSTEPGVAGIQVQAVGVKNGLVYETVSDSNGDYSFTQLRPGLYNIVVKLPDGFGFTKYNKNNRSVITEEGVSTGSRQLDLNNAKTSKDQNVGIIPTGSIQLKCFEDANNNGLLDDGEQTLSNVKCLLYKQGSNSAMISAIADENGIVTFNSLRPGQYKVRTTLPEKTSYSYTKAAAGGNQHTAKLGVQTATVENISVDVGAQLTLVVGAIIPGTISGTVYMDDDFNGQMDAHETGSRDVSVSLIDAEGSITATVKTDKNGQYTFGSVAPGNYQLSVQAAKDRGFTKSGEGSLITVQSGGVGLTDTFTLGMGEDLVKMNCGMIIPGLVDGTVWADDNDNQQRDAQEGGLTNMLVRLVNVDGTITETTPDSNGYYTFDAVIPGVYHIEYILPENGVFVTNDMDQEMTITSDGQSAYSQSFAMVMAGEKHFGATGALQLIPIGGYAFYDENVNDIKDDNERLLSAVTITFTSQRKDLPNVSTVITTGEDGRFESKLLRPGTYDVSIQLPYGYMLGLASQLPYALNTQVHAASGDCWNELALGVVKPAAVQGSVWMDEDADGHMDLGEGAPAGVELQLINKATNNVAATLVTNENGRFEAAMLMPGEYKLVYTPTDSAEPSLGGDTTFQIVNGQLVMDPLSLHCDEINSDIRLGLISYTSVGGTVWQDHNGKTEPLPGAVVRLLDAAGQVLATVASDETGAYRFDGLHTGTYALDVVLPENHIVVTQHDERIAADAGAVSMMTTCIEGYGKSDLFQIRMGYHQLNMDIGAVGYGTIGDRCWLDLNGNGLQDSDENGLPNMLIQLLYQGQVIAETMTDQYGYYCFSSVYPAEYTLRVTYDASVILPTVMRTDFSNIVSVLPENNTETIAYTVTSNGACYDADMGFVLVDPDVYPLGYGMGKTMQWKTKK